MSSTELVPVEVGDVTYQVPVWMKGLRYLSDEELMANSINHIYEADTLDDALAPAIETVDLAQYAGEQITIFSAGWRPSDFEDSGLPIYVIFDMEAASGPAVVCTCGAPKVVAALDRAAAEKAFPLTVRVVATTTRRGAGKEMLSLARVRTGGEDF